jgi:predicted nucleic acid-binding protein
MKGGSKRSKMKEKKRNLGDMNKKTRLSLLCKSYSNMLKEGTFSEKVLNEYSNQIDKLEEEIRLEEEQGKKMAKLLGLDKLKPEVKENNKREICYKEVDLDIISNLEDLSNLDIKK